MFYSALCGGLLLVLFAYLAPIIWAVSRRRSVLKHLPGLKQKFFIGHAQHFYKNPPPVILETIWKGFKECGKTWKIFMMQDTLVFSADPAVLEIVLSSQRLINKSNEYGVLKNWLGDGLLMSKGKKWLGRRRAITPAFHFKILEQFVDVFDKTSSIMVDKLKKHKPTDAVDIYPLVGLAALDVICETSMGVSINSQLNSESEYVKAVQAIATILHQRMFDVFLRNEFLFPFTKEAKEEKAALKVLHQFTDSVIVGRRKELLEKQSASNASDDEFGMKKKMALLDVLLHSTIDGKPLTNADIREEVDTFMFEGHDTTTSGISFTLYCIAKYPEVQQKLVKELEDVVGDKTTPVTLQMLNNMNYLELVLKESMRVLPPVAFVGRIIEEDITLRNHRIPAGTNFFIGIMFMHMDPELFPEPEVFRPERFLEERDSRKFNPYSYLPFSAGPRNCIGQKFAMLEMKSLVSKIIRNYEISIDPAYTEPILMAELVVKPQNGIMLNFKERK